MTKYDYATKHKLYNDIVKIFRIAYNQKGQNYLYNCLIDAMDNQKGLVDIAKEYVTIIKEMELDWTGYGYVR